MLWCCVVLCCGVVLCCVAWCVVFCDLWCVAVCGVLWCVMLTIELKSFHFKVQQQNMSSSSLALLLRLFRLKKYGYWIGNAC